MYVNYNYKQNPTKIAIKRDKSGPIGYNLMNVPRLLFSINNTMSSKKITRLKTPSRPKDNIKST